MMSVSDFKSEFIFRKLNCAIHVLKFSLFNFILGKSSFEQKGPKRQGNNWETPPCSLIF